MWHVKFPSFYPSIVPLSELFISDDYTPITVKTDEQFKGVLEIFPYEDPKLAAAPYPKSFPFSSMVYQIFYQLRQFVVNCTNFADKLNLRYVFSSSFCWSFSISAVLNEFEYMYVHMFMYIDFS